MSEPIDLNYSTQSLYQVDIDQDLSVDEKSEADEISELDEYSLKNRSKSVTWDVGLKKAVYTDLQHNKNQNLKQFEAQHQVSSGRDWDFSDLNGMQEIAQHATEKIRTRVNGKSTFDEFNRLLSENLANNLEKLSEQDQQQVSKLYAEFVQIGSELKGMREELTAGIPKDFSKFKEPLKALNTIKKTLRVFRYETQKILNSFDPDAVQRMGVIEGGLRAVQNFFTFGIDHHVKQDDIVKILDCETRLRNKLAEINQLFAAVNIKTVDLPDDFSLKSTLKDTLEISHRTNEQIRKFNDKYAKNSVMRGIVGEYGKRSGTRKVEFVLGVGALIGLGFPKAITAGIKAGAKIRVTGEINSNGKNKAIDVTYRIAGGLEAGLLAKGGKGLGVEALNAKANGSGMLSHFVTRSYATVEDLILDAKRCKFATSRTLGNFFTDLLKSTGRLIGHLGCKVFRSLGRHSGEVLWSNQQYLDKLKQKGVVGKLDTILAKRANPVVVEERKGWTGHLAADASIGATLGILKLSAGGSAEHQRDFKVSSTTYAPVAKLIRSRANEADLISLLRSDNDLASKPTLPADDADLAEIFDELINTTKNNLPKHDKQWTSFANQLRTLMIAVEVRHRKDQLSREEADRLLHRFSNPPIKIPAEIFREYLMEGSGAGKPAKIRNNASAEIKVDLFNEQLSGLTDGIQNSFVKAVANAGVKEMAYQTGLNTTLRYRFSSEKPVPGSTDPRPWENIVKTSHELVVSASTPMRIILDTMVKSYVEDHKNSELTVFISKEDVGIEFLKAGKEIFKSIRNDAASEALKGFIGKSVVGLLGASVKESAKALLLKWLSNPENLEDLCQFIFDQVDEHFDDIIKLCEWIAEHPESFKMALADFKAYLSGAKLVSESERNKVVKWSYVDGKLEKVSLKKEKINKLGLNIKPLGVGLGASLDLTYAVSETFSESGLVIAGSLKSMLGRVEEYLIADQSVDSAKSSQLLKGYLSRNIHGVINMVRELNSNDNFQDTMQLLQGALEAANEDAELTDRILKAWDQVSKIQDDTPNFKIVDATHDLLLAMTQAYRKPVEAASRASMAA